MSIMSQDEYRDLYKKLNKKWNDSVSIFKEILEQNITEDTTILDAGCGFSNMLTSEYNKAKRVIGVDVSEEFLSKNPILNEKIVANLESIPQVKSNSIDLIISSWVFEHLERPKKVFLEFSRVLRKGGKIVFITPNVWNYVVILNRIIPEKLRLKVVKKMNKKLVTDPMPTFYRANSKRVIEKLTETYGLKLEKLILNGDPTYVAINRLFFWIGVFIEAFLSLPFFSRTRVHLIGVLKKNST